MASRLGNSDAPEPESVVPRDAATLSRVQSVLAILRGVPPAKVAAEARVSEADLYGWRAASTSGGVNARARA